MNCKKTLNNFEPFNDLFYKNCFYNSLFPIINHFNKDITPILINDIPIYEYSKVNEEDIFVMNYLSMQKLDYVLEHIGLITEKYNSKLDIIPKITESIWYGKPVITWVDCFYESIRKDSYKKNHWRHTLCIYGYDENSKTVDILEHKNRDTLSYEKCVIGYSDIKNAYSGYYDNFQYDNQTITYYEFSESNNTSVNHVYVDKNSYIKVYINYIKENNDIISKSLDSLKNFVNYCEIIMCDKTELFKSADTIISSMNSIINTKLVEKYKLERLLKAQHNILYILNLIIESWNEIRAIIVKYKYSSRYSEEKVNYALEKLKLINEIESLYQEQLITIE